MDVYSQPLRIAGKPREPFQKGGLTTPPVACEEESTIRAVVVSQCVRNNAELLLAAEEVLRPAAERGVKGIVDGRHSFSLAV